MQYMVFLLIATGGAIYFVSRGAERTFMLSLGAAQWLVYGVILYVSSTTHRFTGGGDDLSYYLLALEGGSSTLGEVLNPDRYSRRLEQPGYGVLLSVVHNVFGAELGGLKLTNIAFYIVVTATYARIASELRGRQFAKLVAIFVAGLMPLWYYYLFLLKDMAIVLLQGLVLLGAVRIYKAGGRGGWVLTSVGTLAVVPFRSFLVVFNIAVASLAAALIRPSNVRSYKRKRRINWPSILSIVGCLVLFYVATNSTLSQSLGLTTQSRLISADTVSAFAMERFRSSSIQRTLFPFLYLISESSGLQTLFSGAHITAERLRGLFALPWIMFYLPLLLVGLWTIAFGPDRRKFWASPWIVVVGFCALYLAVSWIVGDTTRWRLPDLPALTTIAALGYSHISRPVRGLLLSSWLAAVVGIAAVFYLR